MKERVDLVELQSEDLSKKVQIISAYEGHQINRKAIENLNSRLMELESAAGKKPFGSAADAAGRRTNPSAAAVEQFTDCFFGS